MKFVINAISKRMVLFLAKFALKVITELRWQKSKSIRRWTKLSGTLLTLQRRDCREPKLISAEAPL